MLSRALTQVFHALWPWYAIKALITVAETPKTMVRMASVPKDEDDMLGDEVILTVNSC